MRDPHTDALCKAEPHSAFVEWHHLEADRTQQRANGLKKGDITQVRKIDRTNVGNPRSLLARHNQRVMQLAQKALLRALLATARRHAGEARLSGSETKLRRRIRLDSEDYRHRPRSFHHLGEPRPRLASGADCSFRVPNECPLSRDKRNAVGFVRERLRVCTPRDGERFYSPT